MITNERQYKITRGQAERFKKTISEIADSKPRGDIHPLLIKAQMDALKSQLQDLQEELAEYEHLKSADVHTISIGSLEELADGLIKARVASGLSQKALADRLGLKEQQIQRYEADRYGSASYQRLQEVAGAIGVRVRNDILLPVIPTTFRKLQSKLSQIGLDRDFLFKRLLSTADASRANGEVATEGEDVLTARVASLVERIFGWGHTELFGAPPLTTPRFAAAAARFKVPARRSQADTSLYASYANYLAVIVVGGYAESAKHRIPDNAAEIREAVERKYGQFDLRSVLNYSWDLGVPVLPLRDKGTFHGACWRYQFRNVIVLKQAADYQARWLFDLLHELFHAAQHPETETLEVIEGDETSAERRQSSEEVAASKFAGNAILKGKADQIANDCVTASKGSVERLKSVVPRIAEQYGLSTGAVANYLAFRLSWQGINWWGTAANLQSSDCGAWEVARDVFVARFTFRFESDVDRHLLERALQA